MTEFYSLVLDKLKILNINLSNIPDLDKIIYISIKDVFDYIYFNISQNFDYSTSQSTIVDLSTSNVLSILKNTNFIDTISEPDLKSISEGDISISYNIKNYTSKEDKIDFLINYFHNKKANLNKFKSIGW